MGLLIDGHNLIARLPDIDLADPEDEAKLVAKLKRWAAADRKRKATVIFDAGLPGGRDPSLSNSSITVIFAVGGVSADSLIINRIRKARDVAALIVVTSDQAIVAVAQQRKMRVLRSEEFAQVLAAADARVQRRDPADDEPDPRLSPNELQEWLELFGPEPETAPRPAAKPAKTQSPQPNPETAKAQKKAQDEAHKQAEELAEWMRLFGYKE